MAISPRSAYRAHCITGCIDWQYDYIVYRCIFHLLHQHDLPPRIVGLHEIHRRQADERAHVDKAIQFLLLPVYNPLHQLPRHRLIDLRPPFPLETVGDMHEHPDGIVVNILIP
jgi:hypothetical protein